MQIFDSKSALSAALKGYKNIGLVPTMGNLHAGHMHLVNLAKQHTDCVVVSIFVNPLQFGVNEDLANYPRTLKADLEKLNVASVDFVFTPSVAELYANFDESNLYQTMTIALPPIADALCGASRPGHFGGVATIVAKLFNIIKPQMAFFGKKDFQQLFIIRELVRQFNYPVEIIAGETVRDTNGLALSSRNGYLSESARVKASQLNQALQGIVKNIKEGDLNFINLERKASQQLTTIGWLVDYISIRSADSLLPANTNDKNLVVLGAAKIEKTRLIDNIEFCAK